MFFLPHMMQRRFGHANLNSGATWWLAKNPGKSAESLAIPENTTAMLDAYHHELGLEWSHSDWMTDRSTLWQGTYLKQRGLWIHTGLDLNVEGGTTVLAPLAGEVVYEGTDAPLKGGWGYHVIQIVQYRDRQHALLYAHLNKPRLPRKSRSLKKRAIVGTVGSAPHNGEWYDHLHIQLFSDIESVTDWRAFSNEMDGYVQPQDLSIWARKCPDPTPLVFT